MEIRLASLLQGAQEAEGTTIIIDVFRAFTTAAVAFDRGAEQIVLVAEVEEALDLCRRGVGHLCMGEVDGKRPAGFDFGNSPYEVSQADFTGKTLIQSTRAGTVGVNAATAADTLYLGLLGHCHSDRQRHPGQRAAAGEHRCHGVCGDVALRRR